MTATRESDARGTWLLPATPHSQPVRDLFTSIPTAVSAFCAVVDGTPQGIIATSLAAGVSYDPPMVAFSVLKSSRTWPVLRRAGRIGVSVLNEGQTEVARQIASRAGDRFAGLNTVATSEGALFIEGATAWMDCAMAGVADAGDHELVTLRMRRLHSVPQGRPLLFHQSGFRRLGAPAALPATHLGDASGEGRTASEQASADGY